MTTKIHSIETVYKGYRFRSRLEARWAVFFDALGLTWEYEAQDYLIEDRRYLPDFKLTLPHEEIVFAEVKNAEVDDCEGEPVALCRGLARLTGCRVLLLIGPPTYRLYNQFTPTLAPTSFMAAFFRDYGTLLTDADAWWFDKAVCNESTGALEFHGDERDMRGSFGRGLVAAVNAARQARFEWGERGAPQVPPPGRAPRGQR